MSTINAVNNGLSGATGTGSFVGSTSPTITTPTVFQINAGSGGTPAAILQLYNSGTPVNNFSMVNSDTGGNLLLEAVGSDTNITMQLETKGSGQFLLQSAAPTTPLIIYNGTGSQHLTLFSFSNTAVARTVTFPDASGTVAFVGGSLGAITASSLTFSPTTGGIVGTTTNDNVTAGDVGEYVESNIAFAGNSISNSTQTNLTSISLTAGDWDVYGSVGVTASAAITLLQASISTGTATQADASRQIYVAPVAISTAVIQTVPSQRLSLSTTTVVYLVVLANFTVTATMYGTLSARRRR